MNGSKQKEKSKIFILASCGIMLALSVVLSQLTKFFQMPAGGSVDVCSMLPLFIIGYYFGIKYGLATAFAYSVINMIFALGEVMAWGLTPLTLGACIVLDYILAFTVLGLSGIFHSIANRKGGFFARHSYLAFLFGMIFVVILRFICHFISGIALFSSWATIQPVWLYSVVYNGGFLLPNLVLCIAVGSVLFVPMNKAFKNL